MEPSDLELTPPEMNGLRQCAMKSGNTGATTVKMDSPGLGCYENKYSVGGCTPELRVNGTAAGYSWSETRS